MRKTFAFNKDRNIKPNYGNQKPELKLIDNNDDPVKHLKSKLSDKESRVNAVNYVRMRQALRHVKMIDEWGIDRWRKVHDKKWRNWIGKSRYDGLVADMKKIRNGEWSE